MAVKVRVRNFQSIEDASIEIKGLTVITGTNNAGKSAMFRAIKGALCNTPGTDFVRIGSSHCTVDLEFDDGNKLSWEKGKNVNTYTINGKSFPKVGRGRPEELSVFQVDPITVGDEVLWPQIASQFKVTFLLDKTGSAVADAVADVERVNTLNKALKSCESDRRKVKGALKIRKSDKESLAQKRAGFNGLDSEISHLEDLEVRWAKADKFLRALQNVYKIKERLRSAQATVDFFDGFEESAATLPEETQTTQVLDVKNRLTEACDLKKAHNEAQTLVLFLKEVDVVERTLPSEERLLFANRFRQALGLTVDLATRYQEAKKDYDLLDAFEGHDLDEECLTQALKFKQVIAKMSEMRTRLNKALEENLDIGTQLRSYEEELSELEAELSTIFGNLEECPTCGGELDHTHT